MERIIPPRVKRMAFGDSDQSQDESLTYAILDKGEAGIH